MAWYYNNHSGEEHHATNPVDDAVYTASTKTGTGWHKYATQAAMLASIKAHGWPMPTGSIVGGLGNATGIHNPITDVTHFLTSGDTWVRVGEVLAGAILLIAGVSAVLKVKPAGVAKIAAKAVAL